MSGVPGGIDSLNAHEEAAASSCKSKCSPTPLTTVYTPPASCTDNWTPVKLYSTYAGVAVSLTRNVTATDCVPTQWIPDCLDCPGSSDISNISPGVCPDDAPAASTGIVGGVTTHYCCPFTNATFTQREGPARCYQTFSGLMTLSYNKTIYTSIDSFVTLSEASATERPSYTWTSWNTTSITTTAETVFFKLGTLEAEPLIVRFKKADFQTSSSTASTPSIGQSTATSTEAAATTETSVNIKDIGLTSGAKAGIRVGAALGALLLVTVGLAVFWLRKKKRKNNHGEKDIGRP